MKSYRALFLTIFLCVIQCNPKPAQKINELVASQSLLSDRILYLLGEPAQKRTVIISALADSEQYSTVQGLWPSSAQRSDLLGEAILRSKAATVFVTPYSNPSVVALLQSSNIKVIELPGITGFESFKKAVDVIGSELNLQNKSKQVNQDFENSIDQFRSIPRNLTMFAYLDGFTAGSKTVLHDAMEVTGYTNAAAKAGIIGFKKVGIEQFLRWDADFVLLPCKPNCKQAQENFLKLPAVKDTFRGTVVAVADKKLNAVDDTVIQLLGELQAL